MLTGWEETFHSVQHSDVYFKYLTILFVNYAAIKLKKKKIGEEEGSEGYNAIKTEQELAQAWI